RRQVPGQVLVVHPKAVVAVADEHEREAARVDACVTARGGGRVPDLRHERALAARVGQPERRDADPEAAGAAWVERVGVVRDEQRGEQEKPGAHGGALTPCAARATTVWWTRA